MGMVFNNWFKPLVKKGFEMESWQEICAETTQRVIEKTRAKMATLSDEALRDESDLELEVMRDGFGEMLADGTHLGKVRFGLILSELSRRGLINSIDAIYMRALQP